MDNRMLMLETPAAELEIDKDLLIIRPREGVDIDAGACLECMDIAAAHFDNDWALVIDMVKPSSMQLAAIHAIRDNPRINRVVVVCYRNVTELAMRQSLEMVDKPGTTATSLDEARRWIDRDRAVGLIA